MSKKRHFILKCNENVIYKKKKTEIRKSSFRKGLEGQKNKSKYA